MKFRWWFFLLGLVAFMPAIGGAQTTEPAEAEPPPTSVTAAAMGQSDIRDKNTAEARQRATADGLEGAVRQAALAVLGAEAIGADLSRFLSAISGQAETFVETYRVLGTAPTGNAFRVLVEATVSVETLRNRLGRFAGSAAEAASSPDEPKADEGAPGVLLLMAHQDLEDISPEFWWGEGPGPADVPAEKALAETLEAAGLQVIPHGNEAPDVAVQGAIIFQPDLNDQEALAIAESLDADLVVVGKAIVYRVPETAPDAPPSFNATVTARVLRVATGERLDSVLETVVRVAEDTAAEGREALTAAGRQAGEKLAETLSGMETTTDSAAPVMPEPAPPGDLEVVVQGAGNLGNFVHFRRKLTGIEGVSGLQIRRMQGDQATLSVTYPDGADALARVLSELTFDLFSISVQAPDPDRLQVALTPR
ncbi:MAG: hypothetical protein ACLFN9_18980 [Desulfococcaceae bacterium]